MYLVVSHKSALMYWRRFRGQITQLPKVKDPHPMKCPVCLGESLLAELGALGFSPTEEHPLDLLYSLKELRSQAHRIAGHSVSAPLPPKMLLRLSEHVAIVSPELCFAQAARTHSRGQLLMAGCEMCGTYRLIGDDGRKLAKPEERAPLTSADEIRSVLCAMGRGREANASRAARFIFDKAASPMEARVALLLSLPQTMGGFGLPRPELNAPITLSPAAYRVYPCSPCRMDLFWQEANLDIEYDGGDHTEETRERDAARIVALRMEGMDVVVLMKQQVFDVHSMAAIAKMAAAKLGRRLRISTSDFEQRHRQLRQEMGL